MYDTLFPQGQTFKKIWEIQILFWRGKPWLYLAQVRQLIGPNVNGFLNIYFVFWQLDRKTDFFSGRVVPIFPVVLDLWLKTKLI